MNNFFEIVYKEDLKSSGFYLTVLYWRGDSFQWCWFDTFEFIIPHDINGFSILDGIRTIENHQPFVHIKHEHIVKLIKSEDDSNISVAMNLMNLPDNPNEFANYFDLKPY